MDRPTDDQTRDARKDVLRGGEGERGRPTDPPTNDDLLNGGSGELGSIDTDAPEVDEEPIGDPPRST